ncbi:trypsin-like serine protease [Rhodococcus qingshengii]|uniref:trypsin-like serine protease n=1 Tax=Rhodococcus qingshengii TaxID=334542 RepID=UPI003659853C
MKRMMRNVLTCTMAIGVSLAVAWPAAAAPDTPIPGGGYHVKVWGGTGTIGLAWANDANEPIAHLTARHVGSETSPMHVQKTGTIPSTTLTKTKNAPAGTDVGLTTLNTSGQVRPTIELPEGKTLKVVDYAKSGDEVKVGQVACQQGWNATTSRNGERCGKVIKVSDSRCSSGNCYIKVADNGKSIASGGDSGSALYEYVGQSENTVKILGVTSSGSDTFSNFTPIYRAIQEFGGHPYVE